MISARNFKALFEREASEAKIEEPKPFRIAEAIPVDINVVRDAEWIEEAGFAHGIFTIVATGAKSISINFSKFRLPERTELYIYSENGEMVTGPVTENENNPNDIWGSWVYKGSMITVELRTPTMLKGALKLHISSVAYGYKDLYVSDFGFSSSCNVNVLCAGGFENERNSVALILDASSTALCSGALINNTSNLNIPYFLTANHCFDGNAAGWKFTFKAFSPTCSPSQNAPGITFNGSTLRARNAASDFCLLELNSVPPASTCIVAAGWSRFSTAPSSGSSITHPQGDVMKIATYNTTLTQQGSLWHVFWSSGTVEPGSSGGPLFDSNRRIIGQVYGGNPADICTNFDNAYFGRFDVSWTGGGTNSTRLSNWLDPLSTAAWTTNARLADMSISGPSLICSAGQFLATSTVTWSSSNPSGLSINPNTGVATRQNNFDGSVTITATSTDCSGGPTISKVIGVGRPPANGNTLIWTGTRGVNPVTTNPSATYLFRVDPVPNATSYTWVLPSGFTVLNNGQTTTPFTSIYITTSSISGTYTLLCSANNSCGSKYANGLTINNTGGGGPPPLLMVFPNPTSTSLTIESKVENKDLDNSQSTLFESFSAKLVDQSNFEVRAGTSEMGKLIFDVCNVQKGVYFLRIVRGDELIVRQIVIDK